METNEENKIINLLKNEADKINPEVSMFSFMLQALSDKPAKKEKRLPILSQYFSFEKRTLVYAGALALIAFILITPQMKTQTEFADQDDLVNNLVANSADEDNSILGSGENITLSSFDAGTTSDLNNLSVAL